MADYKMDKRYVNGYQFAGEDDADLARQEEKKIAYLEQHMNYNEPNTVLKIYCKAIEERIFKTPIGFDYLRRVQDFLLSCQGITPDMVPPIKMYVNFKPRLRESSNPARNRVKPPKEKAKVSPMFFSVLLNIALSVLVLLMFFIAVESDNPNVINYENVINNKYASWEQELTEREKVIREKERELKIDNGEIENSSSR
ncbi:MAG: hypothetical protein IJY10_06500 [Lachnospiraceae bacterium]|nr:hypothetical protein [Lachnospiraceae bacterium]MBQ9123129.1 hypothetical protein [Lachnospiraceae bacterium]